MKYFIYIIFILLLLAVNTELARILSSAPFWVNLLLLPPVFFALEKKGFDFLFLALAGGLLLDSFNAAPFGAFTLSFILISGVLSWAAWVFSAGEYEINWKFLSLAVIFAFVAAESLVRLFSGILPANEPISLSQAFSNFFPSIIYGSLAQLTLFLPVYFMFRALERMLEKMENRRMTVK